MQSKNITLSVVMPFFNAAKHLLHTLPALLRQQAPFRCEILLIDNGSTDESRKVVDGFLCAEHDFPARVISVVEPGSYAARQRGLEEARGEFVLFVDADCVLTPSVFEQLVKTLEQRRVLVAGGRVVEASGQTGWVVRYSARAALLSQQLTLRQGPRAFVQTACLAVRREEALAVGGFDVSLFSGGDADFCWRLRARFPGRDLVEVAEASVEHRHRETLRELYAQFYRYGTGDVALWRKHGCRPLRVFAKAGIDFLRVVLAIPTMVLLAIPALLARDVVLCLAPWARLVRIIARWRGQWVALRRGALPRA
jgi:glycosyltransferase involved in cell wall biosynthesis